MPGPAIDDLRTTRMFAPCSLGVPGTWIKLFDGHSRIDTFAASTHDGPKELVPE
jgi:hypothetical protein